MDYVVYCHEAANEVLVIPFFEKTWFFWWSIAVVVILRWLHVISCSASHEPLGEPVATGKDTPSDVDALAPMNRTPRGLGRKHAY